MLNKYLKQTGEALASNIRNYINFRFWHETDRLTHCEIHYKRGTKV
jgi:hypothetical protein